MEKKRKGFSPQDAVRLSAEAAALRRKGIFVKAPEFFEHIGHPYTFRICPITGRKITVIDIKGALQRAKSRKNRD